MTITRLSSGAWNSGSGVSGGGCYSFRGDRGMNGVSPGCELAGPVGEVPRPFGGAAGLGRFTATAVPPSDCSGDSVDLSGPGGRAAGSPGGAGCRARTAGDGVWASGASPSVGDPVGVAGSGVSVVAGSVPALGSSVWAESFVSSAGPVASSTTGWGSPVPGFGASGGCLPCKAAAVTGAPAGVAEGFGGPSRSCGWRSSNGWFGSSWSRTFTSLVRSAGV